MSEATKACSKCGETKTLDEFNKQRSRKDGHTSWCKECRRAAYLASRSTVIDRVHKYYLEHREERLAYAREYRQRIKTARNETPEVCASRFKVRNEIRQGRMKRPERCSLCGAKSDRIQAHHEDYSKPLDVVWLCEPCHRRIHARYMTINTERQEVTE